MKEKITTLLFLRKGDDILLAMKKRGFGANRYNGVGGKVDPGETIEQALVRECQEEIGVTPLTYQKVAEHDFVQPHGAEPWRMYVHVYVCDSWEGEPTESEEMAPAWFKITEIPYSQMWQDDEFWIPQVVGGDKVYGQFTFAEDETMLSHNVQVVEELPNRPLVNTLQ